MSASLKCPAPTSPPPHPSAAALHAIPQPGTPTDPAILLLFSFFSYSKRERKADTSRAAPDSSTLLQGAQGRPRTLARDAKGAELSPSSPPGAGEGAGQRVSPSLPGLRSGAAAPGAPWRGQSESEATPETLLGVAAGAM